MRALALLAASALAACGGPGNYSWAWYIFDPTDPRGLGHLRFMVDGAWATVSISLASILVSVALGLVVAMLAMSGNRILLWTNRVYVESVRAVPVLVLLLWVYYGLPVVIGLQLSVFAAGLITLALSDSAFEAEVFRAGIQSVPTGQTEAAASLGLGWAKIMWLVVLPQAVRRVLPALGNQFVYVLKMSSLISVIGYQELTRRANELTVTEYRPLEIYSVLVLEYLALILLASYLVRGLERRMASAPQ
ncbi:MAG: amino acid ABC transporter permease [Proteobacteria bacterium]|nr:amino acid ABC transporter permease [Pseudomonadota bacterium]